MKKIILPFFLSILLVFSSMLQGAAIDILNGISSEGSCPVEIGVFETDDCGLVHFEIGSFVEGEEVVWYPGDETGPVEGGHFFAHTYAEPGEYEICAFYTSPDCPGGTELCATFMVQECQEDDCPTEILIEDLFCDSLLFYVNSAGPGNVIWDFGNGTADTSGVNASAVYADGNYVVTAQFSGTGCPDGVMLAAEIQIDCETGTDCPDQIWSNTTETCGLVHFEIGSFVSGEDVIWYPGDGTGPIEGGHFLAHTYSSPGLYEVCAFYMSPACPNGVELCSNIFVEACEDDCPTTIEAVEIDCNSYVFSIGGVESGDVYWTFGDGSDDPAGIFADHSFLNDDTYVVMAQYSGPGCPGGTLLTLEVNVNCTTEDDCPSEMFAGATDDCGVMHFEIGSFVQGEAVVWYPGDETGAVEGGHFFSHTYAEPGTYNVCAFYTSPACPGGVEICTEIEVEPCGTEFECPTEIGVVVTDDCGLINFEIGSFVQGEDVTWYPGDETGAVEGGHFFSHTYAEPGIYNVCAFYMSPECPNGVELCTVVIVNPCTVGNDCPETIWSGPTGDCHNWQFEIGSFVQGESVTWYFGDDLVGIVGGHFIAHEFEASGVHSVCAHYTSSLCPDGVWLCTEIEVDCGEVECGIEITAQQTGEFSYTFMATGNPEVNPMHWTVSTGFELDATWVLDMEFEAAGSYTICGWVENEVCGVVEDCITIEVGSNTPCELDVTVVEQACELLVLHGFTDENVDIHWTVDGQQASLGSIATFDLSAGQHQVCAWYETEECGEVVWCETFNIVGCGDCTEVNFGLDSYVGEGGPSVAYWLLFNEGNMIDQGSISYSSKDPFEDFSMCLEDGCYTLTIEGLGVAGEYFNALVQVGGNSVAQDINIINDNLYEITFGVNSDCSGGDCDASFEIFYTNTAGHIEFENTSSGENAQYSWSYGDGQTSNSTGGNVWYEQNGIYEVCLTIYSGGCTDTYCEYVVVTGMEGACEDNLVVLSVSGDYDAAKIYDMLGIGLEFNNEEISSWGILISDNVSGTLEACLPDGCYELTLSSEIGILANMVEVEVLVNGETVDVLNVLNNATEGSINFGLNAKCTDNIEEMISGEWLVYPNPAGDYLRIMGTGDVVAEYLEIIDATGRIILSTTQVNMPVDVSVLSAGYYYVRIISEGTGTVIPVTVIR